MKILVTGASGYIGFHFVVEAIKRGFDVIAVDKKELNKKQKYFLKEKENNLVFYKTDILNKKKLENIFKKEDIEAIFHFAALVSVKESVENPYLYYKNNFLGTLNLLELMEKYNVKNLIFSSSAAVYGNPKYLPIDENHPTSSENPYGSSKLLAEEIIRQYNKWKKINAIIFRYFNVIGNYYSETKNKDSLLYALKKALKTGKIIIYGKNYNTKDGTTIRDYIDVLDLVEAHFLGLDYLKKEVNCFEIFNLGTGKGYTVLEVVKTFERVSKIKLKINFLDRRKGDVEKLFCSFEKAKRLLNWNPKRNLEESVASILNF